MEMKGGVFTYKKYVINELDREHIVQGILLNNSMFILVLINYSIIKECEDDVSQEICFLLY